tara:strand:- start:996 stop:1361 length:366 start_codon:yes stop_codon:yes gene_type:complete
MEIQNLPKNTDPLEEHEMKIFENLYTKEFMTDNVKNDTSSTDDCGTKNIDMFVKLAIIILIESIFNSNKIKKTLKLNDFSIQIVKIILLFIFTVVFQYESEKCKQFFTSTYHSIKSNEENN